MEGLPDNCIDLIVTSPPYDKLRVYEGYSFDFKRIAANAYRTLKDGGTLVWVMGDQTIKGSETGTSFKMALYFMEIGFKLYDTMIYRKSNFVPQNNRRYEQEFEYIFVLVKGNLKTFNPIKIPCKTAGAVYNLRRKGYGFKGGSSRRRDEILTTKGDKTAGNVFSYGCGASGKNHPAVFPAALARDQILSWSNPLGVVLDFFSGSGTTCEEAKKSGRYFLGCDISEKYVKDSIERLDKVELVTDLL